jgi:hypothetical protein
LTGDQHIEHILTGQQSIRHADQPNVFYFFSTAQNILKFLTSRTNGTFGSARHTSQPFATAEQSRTPLKINYDVSKTKRAIFCPRINDDFGYIKSIFTDIKTNYKFKVYNQ